MSPRAGKCPDSAAADRHRKPSAAADSAGPARRAAPAATHQSGHGPVLVERSAVDDRLCPGKRGGSGRPIATAQVPLAAGPERGTDYYRHEGTDQSTDGTIILDDKTAFAAGGGATLTLALPMRFSGRWPTSRNWRPRRRTFRRPGTMHCCRGPGLFRRAAGPRHAGRHAGRGGQMPRC